MGPRPLLGGGTEGLLQGRPVLPTSSCRSWREGDSGLGVPVSGRFWWSPGKASAYLVDLQTRRIRIRPGGGVQENVRRQGRAQASPVCERSPGGGRSPGTAGRRAFPGRGSGTCSSRSSFPCALIGYRPQDGGRALPRSPRGWRERGQATRAPCPPRGWRSGLGASSPLPSCGTLADFRHDPPFRDRCQQVPDRVTRRGRGHAGPAPC